MTKRYKISSIVYSSLIVFSILFFYGIREASGHQIKYSIIDYLIPIYPIINIALLIYYPRIQNTNPILKIFIKILIIICLTVSLCFAFVNQFEIYSGNLIKEFLLFSTIISGIFIASVFFIIKEVLESKANSND